MARVVLLGSFMDDLFLSTKRAHWVCVRYALRRLFKFGLTPARFDLMREIYERHGMKADQDVLRRHLGVARSTLSRMLRVLEGLGWVERARSTFDRRTRTCTLTYDGRRRVAAVMSELIRPKLIAADVERTLRYGGAHPCEIATERKTADFLLLRIRLLLWFTCER
jgi:DNA-binding MarR family transcriptional regulator